MVKVRFVSSPTGSLHIGNALGAGASAPVAVVPALRGAHDLAEARSLVAAVTSPPENRLLLAEEDRPTLGRFRELRAGANGALAAAAAKAILRELKAVGGDLRAVRRVLTGRESGPALWAVLAALPREETLRRVDAAL